MEKLRCKRDSDFRKNEFSDSLTSSDKKVFLGVFVCMRAAAKNPIEVGFILLAEVIDVVSVEKTAIIQN